MKNYVQACGLKGLTVQTMDAQSQETWILALKSKSLNRYMKSVWAQMMHVECVKWMSKNNLKWLWPKEDCKYSSESYTMIGHENIDPKNFHKSFYTQKG